ncbi:MAG: type II secretion system F family protein [bacterium]|nr:type II secretion system F family protein [bacterium]
MPNYIYRAKNKEGETISDVEFFEDEHKLAESLRARDLTLISAVTVPVYKKKTLPWGKISPIERLIFTRNFRVMISVGLPIARIMEILSEQTRSKKFAFILKEINGKLKQGAGLAEAFSGYPMAFDELYVSMLKTGESGSNLENVLAALEEQLRRDYELRSKIKAAMIYPAVIFSALLGVGGMIVFFVMPRLSKAFAGLGAKMPFTLKLFIEINEGLKQHWPAILIILAVSIFFLRFIYKFKGFKKNKDRIILYSPVFGDVVRQINTARFLRTLSSLISGAVPIHQALTIAAGTLNNYLFSRSLEISAAKVQRGQSLHQSLDRKLWPSMVSEMVVIGEETGKLDEILKQLASFYEEEVANTVKNISSLIEPILMIIIGVAIGIFAVSVIQPIYSIMGTF